MAEAIKGDGGAAEAPVIRAIGITDVLEALGAGLRDFRAAPLYSLGVGAIYTVGGWLLILLLVYYSLPYLVYPLAVGFAFIAPFIATAFYAISLALERDTKPSWATILASVRGAMRRDLGWMALVTGFALYLWVDMAALLFFGFFGLSPQTLPEILTQIFTTPMGLAFLVIGNAAGVVISLMVFSISVTSFPMLYDRDVDFVTAMMTSVKVVLRNPVPMVAWCAAIAILMGISVLSGLVGLLVILPVLGHTTWHLYRRVIAPAKVTA